MEWYDKELKISDVIIDSGLQLRVKLSEERISEFVEVFENLPKIKVVEDSGQYYLADGFHRIFAAQRLRADTLVFSVVKGKYRDALEVAVSENGKSALPLSREDKRRAIERVLMFFPERANTWIANDIGTSMQTVESVRKQMEEDGKIEHRETVERSDGVEVPRKNVSSAERAGVVSKEDEDLRSMLRTTKGISVEEKESESNVDMGFRDLSSTMKREEPEQKVVEKKEEKKDKILLSFDVAIVEAINLPTDLYSLVFSRVGEDLDIRLYSGYGDNISPTEIGIRKNYNEFVNKIKRAL